MGTLLESIAKDRDKFMAFLDYLIESGRLTQDEIMEFISQFEDSILVSKEKDSL